LDLGPFFLKGRKRVLVFMAGGGDWRPVFGEGDFIRWNYYAYTFFFRGGGLAGFTAGAVFL
jgi:hypothetical protein